MKVFAVVFAESGKSKRRLSAGFSPEERKLLSEAMLEDVLKAFKSSAVREVVVVGTDSTVGQVVDKCGVSFISQGRAGLSSAIRKATEWCMGKKADALIVLPANIPLVSTKDVDCIVELGSKEPSIVVSPSMKGGVNAVFLNPLNLVDPQFGPEGFFKLVKEAVNKNVALRFHSSREIALNVDTEQDLCRLLEIKNNSITKQVFEQILLKRKKKN